MNPSKKFNCRCFDDVEISREKEEYHIVDMGKTEEKQFDDGYSTSFFKPCIINII